MRTDKLGKYLRHAESMAAIFSKDRSTKVGALFLHPTEFTQLASGYNGIPRGCDDDAEHRHARPAKYQYFEHAERNAIYNAVREQLRGTVAVVTAEPDMEDVRALLSVGIVALYAAQPVQNPCALELLNEAGVVLLQKGNPEQVEAAGFKLHKLEAYLNRASQLRSELSKDGAGASEALFLRPDGYIVVTEGYSGLPRGMRDDNVERMSGEERAFWVESGVRSAIYNLARPLLRGSTVITTQLPCAACARAIAAVGGRLVATAAPSEDFIARWGASFERTRSIFRELDIGVVELKQSQQ